MSVSLTFILPIKLTKLEIYLEMKSNHLTSEPRDRLTDDMSKITKKFKSDLAVDLAAANVLT